MHRYNKTVEYRLLLTQRMQITRRSLLSLLALPAAPLGGQQPQGMASRGVKPAPRGKPSGLPFHARFTDVAQAGGPHRHRGLRASGPLRLHHRNDELRRRLSGLRQRRLARHLRAYGIAIRRSPGGRVQSPVQEQPRRHLHRTSPERPGSHRTGYMYGVTVGDYNNDGFEDLFITGWGQNVLYRNNGDGTFTDVTREAGLLDPQPRFGSGCAFVDYDRDGRLDLFVSNYLLFDMKTIPRPNETGACNYLGVPVNCGPRGLPYGRHSLYHNNGDGTFSDVTAASGIGKAEGGFGLTVVAADFDNDGWPDIYVACDSTPSLLFRNNHDGTFTRARPGARCGSQRRRDGAGRHGPRRSATSTWTAASIS